MFGYAIEMAKHIQLTTEERQTLEQMVKSGVRPARVVGRARALLRLDRSQGPKRTLDEIADAAMISKGTLGNLKKRYFAGGLEGALYEKPRPGAKPKIDGEVEAHLIALVCSEPPAGQARWTLRLLAERLVSLEVVDTISHVAVGEALKKMNLNPGK